MAVILWTRWQERHIERSHGVSATDFEEAWDDPAREDLAEEEDLDMTIIRNDRDPRSPMQRDADRRALDRFRRGDALAVPVEEADAAARRVLARYRERREEVAQLGDQVAQLRRLLGITQEEVARAIGTSKPNICAIEKGRSPGITLERLLAIIEALRLPTRRPGKAIVHRRAGHSLAPSAALHSLAEALETE